MVEYEISYIEDLERRVRQRAQRLETLRDALELEGGAATPGVARVLEVAQSKVKVAEHALELARSADDLEWVDAKQHLDTEVSALDDLVERVAGQVDTPEG